MILIFNKKFNKIYNKIPVSIKPTPTTAKVTYFGAFDPEFVVMLRERRYADLSIMQKDAVQIEASMRAVGKIKRVEVDKEKKKGKEEAGASNSNKDFAETKMEEMSKLIRSLSNKISSMEMEAHTPAKTFPQGPRNPNPHPNQFRRPYNPHILQRDRRNDDQPIQPPVRRNQKNFLEQVIDEEYLEEQEGILLMEEEVDDIHLTETDFYEDVEPEDYAYVECERYGLTLLNTK